MGERNTGRWKTPPAYEMIIITCDGCGSDVSTFEGGFNYPFYNVQEEWDSEDGGGRNLVFHSRDCMIEFLVKEGSDE